MDMLAKFTDVENLNDHFSSLIYAKLAIFQKSIIDNQSISWSVAIFDKISEFPDLEKLNDQ